MEVPANSGEGGGRLLAELLYLARRVRHGGDSNELIYVAMNETHRLLPYRQAALWAEGRVMALSGVVAPEANAPYVQWLKRLVVEISSQPLTAEQDPLSPRLIDAALLPEAVREEWDEWLPVHALWLPLPAVGTHFSGGGWLFARDEPWLDEEAAVLREWGEIWAHAWALQHKPDMATCLDAAKQVIGELFPQREQLQAFRKLLFRPGQWREAIRHAWQSRKFRWSVVVLGVLLFPVRLTVLAPGELVPAKPAVIRAPLDGVIERIAVEPNQTVKPGDVLFEFDRATLASRLAVAEQTFATADAEYRQFAQQALTDDKMKARLVVSLGTLEEKKTEVGLLRELHGRATVTTPQEGIAIFDDPTEWSGRPVSTGEKVMLVAAPDDVEIEAWLSPADAIDLMPGAAVTLYLNTRPFSPVSGVLRYLGHEAQQRPDGHFAYRLRAAIPSGEKGERVGLKGTAKVTGGWVPAGYWILRKPIAALRNLVGV